MKNFKFQKFLEQKSANSFKIDRFLMLRMYEKYKGHFKPKFVIQIIGTNGKGSTGRFLAQLLWNLNFKVGHYTSPHILSFNERFFLHKQMVSNFELNKAHLTLEKLFKKDLQKLSYFEYATFLAMELFQDCDFVILEAGMGAEFDATSVFKSSLSIFTRIDFDHQEFLGKTLKDIARTKLKVMAKTAVISPKQSKIVLNLAQKIASLKQSKLTKAYLNEELKAEFLKYTKKYKLAHFLKENLTLALAACELLKVDTLKALKNLQALNLSARCQKIDENLYIDVGHNVLAAKAIRKHFKAEKLDLIYNSYLDKDIFKILKTLKPIIDTIKIYEYKSPDRALSTKEIKAFACELGISCQSFTRLNKNKKSLVFGSFLLVENFLKEFCDKK